MRQTLPLRRPARRWPALLTTVVTTVVTTVAAAAGLLVAAAPAQADNPVTPGNFTGYGFDQCLAPSQSAMTAWLGSSPFLAVGIYISGDSRGCPSQPNLTTTWVKNQLAAGWRLLPITLGPQASCTTRARYLEQVRISASTTNTYAKARAQGKAEAEKTVAAAGRLGIVAGSTLWYDLEAFDTSKTTCRASAMYFLSAWTQRLQALGYVSGVYSSAASGIKMIDDARRYWPTKYTLPDRLWIADWNGRADVHTSYVPDDGWMPHARAHQYRGGHDETWGGVTINIDSTWVDLGRGSVAATEKAHCGGVRIGWTSYPALAAGSTDTARVKTLQCLLSEAGTYTGAYDGVYDADVTAAVRAWRTKRGLSARNDVTPGAWASLLSTGATPVVKTGSSGDAVRRAQRALDAVGVLHMNHDGVAAATTVAAVRAYQKRVGVTVSGVLNAATWAALAHGRT